MTVRNGSDDTRGGSRFSFVSKVSYVTQSGVPGEEHEGLAFNVSIEGLCLAVDRSLDVGEEIVITKCILPYCKRRYRVRWTDTSDFVTYRVGLARYIKQQPEDV